MEQGHPIAHLYRTETVQNPSVSSKVTNAFGEIFGEVEAMRTYIDIELTNRARWMGEDFITEQDVRRICRSEHHLPAVR